MSTVNKKPLAITIIIFCGLPLLQDALSAETLELEEVIVTAQKRAENAQDIPIAISVLSGSMLDSRGITDVESLASSIPGLHFSQSGSNTRITVRAIGTEQVTATGDPGVAFHIDGVYQARASAGKALFYDLERVEVLRGPQGTLYGRNSTGGSINLITKKPQNTADGNIELQAGNYNQQRLRATLNTPLKDNILLLRVSGQRETRDGYYKNLTPGAQDLEDRDTLNLRTKLLYRPTGNLEALLSVNYSTSQGAGFGGKPLGDFAQSSKFIDLLLQAFATPNPRDAWEVRTNGVEDNNGRRQGASLTLNWDLDAAQLKSITAWQENKVEISLDWDGSDADIVQEYRFQDSVQYSQEIQLSSTNTGPWEWITGVYWLFEQTDVNFWLFDQGNGLSTVRIPVPGGQIPIAPTIDVGLDYPAYLGNKSTIDSDAFGAFAQTSYNLSNALKITTGLRYSKDEKESDVFGKAFTAPDGTGFGNSDSWSKLTWKLGADWFVAVDNLLYTSVSTGFKSGGFLQVDNADSYDEEEVLAFEVGSKNRFLDGRLQTNISAFYYEYTDMQLRTVRNLSSVVANAGEAQIKGIEVELTARPQPSLTLGAALAYTDAKFTDYQDDDPLDAIPATSPLDLSGNDLARSPDYTLNLNASYTWNVLWGSLTSGISYFWSDDIFFSAFNRKSDDFQGSYHRTNIHLQFTSSDKSWYVNLAANNLEDDNIASQMTVRNADLGGVNSVQWQAPKTYNLSVGYHF